MVIRRNLLFAIQSVPSTGRGLRHKSTSKPQPANIYDSAVDYISALRLRAVNALAANLSTEERNRMLQNLEQHSDTSKKNNNDDSHVEQHSIAEVVAAARADEARRNEERWEREKAKLLADAEAAARARVESDLAIQKRQLAFEAWKKEVERAKNGEQLVEKSAEHEHDATDDSIQEHPVLGRALLDLGYKRIHLVSAKSLASIPVWKKQRIYRHGRAESMATDKLKSLHLGMPGIIGIYEVGVADGF